MKDLQKLEVYLKQQFDKSPVHLPEGARKWIGQNAWWIVIVGVVASAISVYASLKALFWADNVLDSYRDIATTYGVTVPDNSNLALDISIWISLITLAIAALIQLRAISPLKAQQKRGWDLVFLASIVSIAGTLLSGIVAGSIISAIFGTALSILIGGFFLFETRSQFTSSKAAAKPVKASAK